MTKSLAKKSAAKSPKSAKVANKATSKKKPIDTLVRETELVSKPGEAEVTVKTAEFSTEAEPEVSTKKSAKTAKVTKAPSVAKVAAKAPNPIMEKLIALMLRPGGAGITDFQQVEGFNIPSMAVVRAAQRAGYEATATKNPGERTVYKATKS